ncbi:hypothetical protein KEJ34_07015 [Candidatus Bathyarchaeota archaeon]|nr:hypothetical protein [Candidatus Bathyarchaeota archaeon]
MHIHEYIFAALVVIAILLASNLMLTMTTEPLKVASEREGLKRIAQSIMTQILLNPGDPVDWGSNTTIGENNLGSFGLAYQSRTVREAYVLDADKILRLKNGANLNPFYISPQKVSELLGLNTREYGFTIEILPQFNITVEEISGGCRVSVKSVDGINPIQYADVTAKMYYLSGGQIYEGSLVNGVTGPDGACTIEFGEAPGAPAVVIFVVDYRGIRVPKVFVPSGSEESVQWALLVGRKLSLSVFSSVIYEVIAPIMDGECEILEVSSGWGVGEDGFAYVEYVEPGTIVALAAAGSDLIIAQRFMDLVEYGTVSLRSPSLPLGFMLEKMVSVEGFSYIVRLYVWRLVW